MKNINRTISLIASLLTAATITMATVAAPVSAETAPAGDTAPYLSSISGISQDAQAKLQEMSQHRITVHLGRSQWFEAKSAKLYGRQVKGFDANGNCILGPWELIHDGAKEFHHKFEIKGTYVMFGYTLDVVWGTDFPYSGVFWDNTNARMNSIYIDYGGGCRNVNIKIMAVYTEAGDNYKKEKRREVVNERNCSAHKEWKPNYINLASDIKYLDKANRFGYENYPD